MKYKETGQFWSLRALGASWLLPRLFFPHQTITRLICRNRWSIALQLCNCMCFAASLTPATDTTLCASLILPVRLYLNSWKYHFIKNKPSSHTRACRPRCPVLARRNRSNRSFLNHSALLRTLFGSLLTILLSYLTVVSLVSHSWMMKIHVCMMTEEAPVSRNLKPSPLSSWLMLAAPRPPVDFVLVSILL